MAVVKSGMFSNPAVPTKAGDPNGPRGGFSDSEFRNVNGSSPIKTVNLSPDPSKQRLDNAGLSKGGAMLGSGGIEGASAAQGRGPIEQIPNTNEVSFIESDESADAPAQAFMDGGSAQKGPADWRIRISVAPSSGILYRGQAGIMYPLLETDGVIFPHLPSVTLNHSARYNSTNLTHSNYTNYFFESAEVQSISISGDFTAQTQSNADYVLAALYFFRAATKMFFGQSGEYQGSPPPIVYLDGYGKHYFPHVPCLVTNFSHSMSDGVDFLPSSSGTRIATLSTFNVQLQPVYSRKRQQEFNYDAFAAGAQLDKGFI
jgi:hypothetical protein